MIETTHLTGKKVAFTILVCTCTLYIFEYRSLSLYIHLVPTYVYVMNAFFCWSFAPVYYYCERKRKGKNGEGLGTRLSQAMS